MNGRAGGRRVFLRTLGAGALLLTVPGLVRPDSAAAAAAEACVADAPAPAVRPVAPLAVSADLPAPFGYRPDATDRAALLAEVATVVREQAAELGADACYLEKAKAIAARVDFLSPYEFLVVTMFDQEPARRDALLDQYAVDPRGAIKALSDKYASTRAQSILMNYAYFDVSNDCIRVNTAHVPPADLRRVLVHEFWHAMPSTRTWKEQDGRTIRANGFWLQEQRVNVPVWLPVDDKRGLPYASYLLDEAMATMMETRYAGPSPMARRELDEVQGYLARLMELAGSGDVLQPYLASEPYQLEALTEEYRANFPEFETVARP